ncbi:uncharacterized protein BDZ99DRAFT_574127 [Mytilinidion resinicola]|uniref:Uncharacterized protein n=1 Tax=Mytilinidion resinicola TaxID=574789 RepID=A0A6A6YB83_9PEZI|nr:uncharacterized protein BDZ99DRAFT_574127 [Mytilinidion resinicola]KAF2805838.1 hypothetical protein BDZ99DRAFT_574127 [Mytilinidion resinicola]
MSPPDVNTESIHEDLTLHLPQHLTEHVIRHFMSSHCRRTDCRWLSLSNLTNYTGAPPLLPDADISGIGAILGFSITSYLTLLLLIVNYAFVFDPHRWGENGRRYTNPLDLKLLGFIRNGSVLILSDTQLVTGLAILSSGYSQLNCGISAYHWQIMVYVAWFASFSFISAMTFLQAFFQANHSLRIIRVCFMFVLATMLIVALLPTGSQNWMDLACKEGEGCFFPSLQAKCYYRQMITNKFDNGHTKIYSMVVSILVVSLSYINCGVKMFDPTSAVTRRYIRVWPGRQIKRVLRRMVRSSEKSMWANIILRLPYLALYSAFTSARALCDTVESMLGEILWLSFAIAWGTIKVWTTRTSSHYDSRGFNTNANPDVLSEDSWSFGQTLPLILLLLPVLSMAQVYFDKDTRILEASNNENWIRETGIRDPEKTPTPCGPRPPASVSLSSVSIGHAAGARTYDAHNTPKHPSTAIDDRTLDSTCACPIARCTHHPSACSSPQPSLHSSSSRSSLSRATSPSLSPSFAPSPTHAPFPTYLDPDTNPYDLPFYTDHLTLWLLQLCFLAAFILWLLNATENILGISFFFRNRLFIIWIFGILPSSLFLHLAFWMLGGWAWEGVRGERVWRWWVGKRSEGRRERWRRVGKGVYAVLRAGLVAGLVTYTFLLSFEAGGPEALVISLEDLG